MLRCTVGIDVGGTNTDAVLLHGSRVLATAKHPTTPDVTTGLIGALRGCLLEYAVSMKGTSSPSLSIQRVNVGTTHFINAVVQRSPVLSRVAVIRLITPPRAFSSEPFSDFPEELSKVINGGWCSVNGGFEFDGTEIDPIDELEIGQQVGRFKKMGISHFAVIGSFATLKNDQETQAKTLILETFPTASVSTSHEIGRIGFMERENATILNESLKVLCENTTRGIQAGLLNLQIKCPLYLTQNDGTICSIEKALEFPILTFASGPTNSMRGAAFVSGVKDGVVVDVGGTTTDVGVLVNGFPRLSGTEMLIGGVRTNFQMPDTLSIGLGGGSLVVFGDEGGDNVKIGPQSVGYRLQSDSICFGGRILTATDVAVCAGLLPGLSNNCGDINITKQQQELVLGEVKRMIEDAADRVKTSAEPTPIVMVGGGSVLIRDNAVLKGASKTLKCNHYPVANAIGAALSQVSGRVDAVYAVDAADSKSRPAAIELAKKRAIEMAVDYGADPEKVEISSFEELPLTYLPGNAVQMKVTAVGPIKENDDLEDINFDLSTLSQLIIDNKDIAEHEMPSILKSDSAGEKPSRESYMSNYPLTPNVDSSSEIWTLNADDVECLAIGAGILGCGGGGNPYLGKLRELQLLRSGKLLKILSFKKFITSSRFEGSAAIPVGFMGAPLTLTEKLQTGKEAGKAVEISMMMHRHKLDELIASKPKIEEFGVTYVTGRMYELAEFVKSRSEQAIVMPFEIGGINSTEPICVAGEIDSICIDGDLMGRAFPELQMITTLIYGESPYPTVSVNDRDEYNIYLDGPKYAKPLENCARKVCIESGCHMAVALPPIPSTRLQKCSIPSSLSRAWKLGHAVQMARKEKRNAIDAILSCENGYFACSGKICDLTRKTTGGFNKGSLKLEDHAGVIFEVDFQNENLRLRKVEKVIAVTPDLICIVESNTGTPVPTESLRYGLRVSIVVIAPSILLTTEKALKCVGPEAFGYSDCPYGMQWESGGKDGWSVFSDKNK